MSDVILFHDEMLNPVHPALAQWPEARRVFVFDTSLIERDGLSLKRLQFIADCVVEIPDIEVYRGRTAVVLAGIGARRVLTQRTPDPWLTAELAQVEVTWMDEPRFVEHSESVMRFTRYWRKVEQQALQIS